MIDGRLREGSRRPQAPQEEKRCEAESMALGRQKLGQDRLSRPCCAQVAVPGVGGCS